MRTAPGWMTVIMLIAASALRADDLENARRFLAEQDYRRAEIALRQASRDPVVAPAANYLWYQTLRERGQDDQAASRLEEAARLAEVRADWWLELGLYLRDLGRREEAMRGFVVALTVDPRYAQAHHALAEELLERGLLKEARAQLEEAIRVSPQADRSWALLCGLMVRQGETLEALQEAQRGLERNPGSRTLRLALAGVYEEMGETGRALETYAALLQEDRDDPDLLLRIGRVHRARGEQREALEAYRRAARLAPEDPGPHVATAWLHLDAPPNPRAAVGAANRALRLDADHVEALTALGWGSHLLRRERDAAENLTRAATAGAPDPRAMFLLGSISHARGDLEDAREWLLKAVAAGEGTPVAAQARALLAQMDAPVEEETAAEEQAPEAP